MTNRELNQFHRGRIKGTCDESVQFDWQDGDFMDILLGGLPHLHKEEVPGNMQDKYAQLVHTYRTYDSLSTDKKQFFSEIKKLVSDIRSVVPNWYGLNLASVEDALNVHKCCLISGEGGIGKSYFIKCFELELEKRGIKHVCLYGKFLKNIDDIDFDEIKEIGNTEEYVFIFDAINEIPDTAQLILIDKIREIIKTHGVRVVLTYRIHAINDSILSQFKKVAASQYEFPGVSFESAMEWLRKIPVIDISEYVDVLYSNNPFLLSKLQLILRKDMSENSSKNNVSRYTYIYEQYIRRSLDEETWKKTKAISKWMYENNTKSIPASKIGELIDRHNEYITKMEQMGFLSHYISNKIMYCTFVIESLADYLIARYMWEDLQERDTDACVAIIENKLEAFNNIHEMLILLLFDKFSPNYEKIIIILRDTKLIEYLSQEILVKVHFRPEDIPTFQKIFIARSHEASLLYFAGYVNKPFNCTNYLNQYYLSDENRQTKELTKLLSKKHFLGSLQSRLKNALYYICMCECTQNRSTETFYTVLWCCSAGNSDIRNLATKLLFEVLQRNDYLIDITISEFPRIKDHYIRDSLIHALAMCPIDERIAKFFNILWNQPDFVMAKSIRRISNYLGCLYQYIGLEKDNLFNPDAGYASKNFEWFLHHVDFIEKELLPFRFWGISSFQSNVEFLATDKEAVKNFNEKLANEFICVKTGDCNGMINFRDKAEEYFGVSISGNLLEGNAFLASFEKVFCDVFRLYGLPFDKDDYLKCSKREHDSLILKKCVSIAVDVFYGSLMCNYYSKEFGTYNNYQDSLGYEVYDSLEYGESINIKSPLSIYRPNIEKLGTLLLNKLDLSCKKDEQWWRSLDHTKNNVRNLMLPIQFQGTEWIMIAGRISVQDDFKKHKWRETYDWFCCTSSEETLKDDGEERHLTIELKTYEGNLEEYASCEFKPWLCKGVSTIAYNSGMFEDTGLILPPAQMIQMQKLHVDLKEMTWKDSNGETVIICNNNKSSYFSDPIMGTVFVRKDFFEQFSKKTPVKFFAFSEKYLDPQGYCEKTAYHFEIFDGQIVKAVPNNRSGKNGTVSEVPDQCQNCKYGFYKPVRWDEISPVVEFLNKYNPQQFDDTLWDM